MAEETDRVELGGNIELAGFKEVDSQSLIILKKIIGNYVKRISNQVGFERITIVKKDVHERESSQIYELHAKLVADGRSHSVEFSDRNIFIALDKVLKKLQALVSK